MTHVIFQTRFAFQPRSATLPPRRAFAPARMEKLFARFERLTLPSMAAQLDDAFRWDILSSAAMPAPYQERLRDSVAQAFGPRAQVHFERPAIAGRYFRNYQARRYAGVARLPLAAQVAMDAGEAVAHDFVSALRWACGESYDLLAQHGYGYLSFPTGYWLWEGHSGKGRKPDGAQLVRTRSLGSRLGLVAFGRADFARNAHLVSHHGLGAQHPVRAFFALHTLHLRPAPFGREILPEAETACFSLENLPASALRRFPMLRDYLGARRGDQIEDWAQGFVPDAQYDQWGQAAPIAAPAGALTAAG